MGTSIKHPISTEDVHRMLEGWRREGLLEAADVARIEAAEAARAAATAGPAAAPDRHIAEQPAGSLLAEALGYAGAGLMIAAGSVLLGRHWTDLSFATQVALATAAAVLLLAGGFAVPEHLTAPGRRLRAMLWAASTVLAFATWTLVAAEDGFGWSVRHVVLFAAGISVVQALLLWWRSRALPQQLVTFGALCVVVGAASGYVPGVPDRAAGAFGVFAVGAAWVALARVGVLRPQLVAYLVGSIVAVSAAQATTAWDWGAVFVVVVAAGVIGFAVWQRSLPILGVGTYAVLTGVPAAAARLFPGSTGVALGLLVAGAVLVGSALWITRHGKVAL